MQGCRGAGVQGASWWLVSATVAVLVGFEAAALARPCGACSPVECVVDSPLRHADNMVLDRPLNFRGVDTVRRTERACGGELVGVDIDRNDPAGTAQLRRLDDGEPDHPAAKDGHARANLHLAGVPHRAPPRDHAAAQEAHLLQGRARGDFGA